MNKLLFNVIHRADTGLEFEGFRFQQEEVHKLGLKSTILVPYTAMYDDEVIKYVKEQAQEFGDEIGIHFHLIRCKQFDEIFNTTENAIYLQPFQLRKQILKHIFGKFEELFGFIPSAIGGYYFDSRTLNWMKETYPQINTAIVSCFEEGVHMFSGTDNSWMLFSEGGPWGTYYPSRENSLCPAKLKEDAIDILALPHLNRDMLLAVTGRDDYFSSHPANVMRGKATEGAHSTYLERFVDQWIEQVQYNGYEYYSLFVSPPWVMEGKIYEESYLDSRKLYTETLEYLKEKQENSKSQCLTMSEYANWYKNNMEIGRAEVNKWKDILCGSKRELFWYADYDYRVTIDPNLGGSITDLRPYAGRVNIDLGPDTARLWNGSYPYLINYEHRAGSAGGSIHTCEINYNGKKVSFADKRTTCTIVYKDEELVKIVLEPIKIQIDELEAAITTTYTFVKGEGISIVRKIEKFSILDAKVTLTEVHRGCWGTTQYPEDMRGIIMNLLGTDGENRQCIEYQYSGRQLCEKGSAVLKVEIPSLNVDVSLSPISDVDECSLEEGVLFAPYYTMKIQKEVSEGEELKTCLKITKR